MAFVKKYWLLGIFISILSVFAMSYNASAIGLTINLNDYDIRRNSTRPNLEMLFDSDTTSCSNASYCVPLNSSNYTSIKSFRTYTALSSNIDDIFVLRVLIASQNPTNGNYSTDVSPIVQKNYTTGNDYLVYLGSDWKQYDAQNIYTVLGVTPASGGDDWASIVQSNYSNLMVVEYYFKVLRDGNYNVGFYSTNASNKSADIFTMPNWDSNSAYYFKILNLTQYQSTESKENKEVEEKTQEAVDESQSAGSSSSSSASQGGANLLTAITGFFNVITSAQPSNCRFNAPLNTYFGNERLDVDLCALDLPSGIGSLTSIIAIGILIPFAIHMFNKFIALFRSFQS